MKDYIKGFDLLKLLLAILVISLHANVSNAFAIDFRIYVQNIQALAVPSFFVMSGILLFRKLNGMEPQEKLQVLVHYLKRILLLYISWTLIMLPITLYFHDYLNHGVLAPVLYLKDFFFSYTFLASWYFGALLVATPIVFALYNKKWILVLAVLFIYVLHTWTDSMPTSMYELNTWYHDNIANPRRSFPEGVLWIGIGALLSTMKQYYNKLSNSKLAMGGVICLLVASLDKSFMAVGVLALVLVFYTLPLRKWSNTILRRCRCYSTIIYCIHFPIIYFVWRLVPEEKAIVVFCATTVICLLVSEIVLRLSRKFKVLKFLF